MEFSNSFPYLLFLRVKTSIKGFFNYLRELKFYKNREFRKADLALMRAYFGVNPYTLCRRYLEKQQETIIHAYGETPLTTLEKIVAIAELNSKDTIFELGCGRGRTCFWLSSFLQAQVIGIDYVPEFIHKANTVNHLKNLQFICEDFLKSDLSQATAIYLHASCMEDDLIRELNKKLITLKAGLKVISVSFPLTDYDTGGHWDLQNVFPANFSWGKTEVYIQVKTH